MVAANAYYDGHSIRLLDRLPAKKNQRLKIEVLDDFMPAQNDTVASLRGFFHVDTTEEMREKEKSVWAESVEDRSE